MQAGVLLTEQAGSDILCADMSVKIKETHHGADMLLMAEHLVQFPCSAACK